MIGPSLHHGLENGAYINLLAELGAYTEKDFNSLNVKFVIKYLYDAVHEVCLGKGVLAGGDLVKYLWQDDTPLHLLVESLKGKKAEDLFLKDGTIPDPISTDNVEFNIVQTIIKRQLEGGETDKWNKIIDMCMGFSEKNFTGGHHMYTMEKTSTNHQNW